jgi:hypothetical protein
MGAGPLLENAERTADMNLHVSQRGRKVVTRGSQRKDILVVDELINIANEESQSAKLSEVIAKCGPDSDTTVS